MYRRPKKEMCIKRKAIKAEERQIAREDRAYTRPDDRLIDYGPLELPINPMRYEELDRDLDPHLLNGNPDPFHKRECKYHYLKYGIFGCDLTTYDAFASVSLNDLDLYGEGPEQHAALRIRRSKSLPDLSDRPDDVFIVRRTFHDHRKHLEHHRIYNICGFRSFANYFPVSLYC